ncbi:MAG TPA: hypothetical protein VIJ20_05385 [Solirubrobacteraceae bacterium]
MTMIAVLAVLALGGGFGGLSALGQLLSGPAVPVASNLPRGPAAPRTASALLPVVPASLPVGRAPTRVAATSPAGAPVAGSRGGGSPAGGGSGQRVASGGSGGHGATPPATAPPSAPTQPPTVSTPTPPPATGPVPSLVSQVVAVGVSVTSKLPAPLAALGTGALESLGQTLNTLLAPAP